MKERYFSFIASIAIISAGMSLFTTYVSVKLDSYSLPTLQMGMMHSLYYSGMLLGSLLVNNTLRRYSAKKIYILFASIAFFSIALQAAYLENIIWMFTRFVLGLCFAAFYIIIESLILAISEEQDRCKALAAYWMAVYTSQFVGNSLLIFTGFNTNSPFIISAFLCVSSVIPLITAKSQTIQISNIRKQKHSAILNKSIIGSVGCLFSGLILSVIYTLTPNFANHYAYSVPTVMQCTIAGGYLLQWPIAKLSDQYGRELMLFINCLGASISASMICVFAHSVICVYLLSFILGACCFSLYTICISMVCKNLKDYQIAHANSLLLFLYGIGSVCGPIIASFMMQSFSYQYLYAYISCLAFILLLAQICEAIKPRRIYNRL